IIKKANGQLRVETQNFEAGYYYKAPYVYPFSFDLDLSFDKETLPDPENAYGILKLSEIFATTVSPGGYGKVSGKFLSVLPIAPSGSIEIFYWNSSVKSTQLSSFSYTGGLFNPLPNLGNLTIWDFSIDCGERKYKPTYTGSIYYSPSKGYSYFMARVV